MASEAQSRVRLAKAIEWENKIKVFGIVAIFVLVIVMLVGGAIAVTRTHDKLDDLSHQADHSECSDRLVADALAAAGRALAAPPAPNPAREAAVFDIIRAADRLSRSDAICAHGVPAPLTPTPVAQNASTSRESTDARRA